MNRVLQYKHFKGYFIALGSKLPEIDILKYVYHTPKFWFQNGAGGRG